MDQLGQFLADLPAPFGLILTALFPPAAIGGGLAAVVAFRRNRRALAIVMLAFAFVSLVCAIAWYAFVTKE
jgi:hypothetical protein